jgi:hypothetical protein
MGRTNSMGGPFQPQRRVLLGAACCALVGGATPAVAQALVLHVAVSARSPWRVVTSKELLALYTGRVRTLADGGPATPLDQRRDGSVRKAFYQALTGLDIARINSYWARLHFTGEVQQPPAVGDDSDVVRRLLADASAVGYLAAEPQDPALRVVLRLQVNPPP